jgi:hypothetical protein
MVVMVLAQVGPLTAVAEALATAVGACAVLDSVAIGIWGLARGLSRADLEIASTVAGYAGGGFGAFLAGADALLRYLLK